jgi:PAS domain S-box-containing protein
MGSMGNRVLVVEDENLIALDMQNRLETLGYIVTGTAGTGDAAIREVRALRPDIVLMDIGLRGPMDGIELSKKMQAEFDLPVVYMTAYADEETVARARDSGAYGYMTKPVGDRQLQIVIEMAKNRHTYDIALRDSGERFRQFAEASSEGMLVYDSGAVLDLNGRMARMLGYKPWDVIGKRLAEFMTPERKGAPGPLARLDEDEPFEATMCRVDGSTFPAEVIDRSMPSGGRTMRLAAVRDVSQRREMERLLNEKVRGELYGFVVSAFPLIAPGALQTVREDLLGVFSDRFETCFRPRFELESVVQSSPGADDLPRYLHWVQELFTNFGISAQTSAPDGYGVLEFHSCPWIEDAKQNPVFCTLCQTMAWHSFSWASPGGAMAVKGTIAGGSRSCRIELRPARRSTQKTVMFDDERAIVTGERVLT